MSIWRLRASRISSSSFRANSSFSCNAARALSALTDSSVSRCSLKSRKDARRSVFCCTISSMLSTETRCVVITSSAELSCAELPLLNDE